MNQQGLFDLNTVLANRPRFDGADYIRDRDDERLTTQLQRIYAVIKDERWRTLEEIAAEAHAPVASASAQLRNLRKQRFGSHNIERRHLGNGLYQYKLSR